MARTAIGRADSGVAISTSVIAQGRNATSAKEFQGHPWPGVFSAQVILSVGLSLFTHALKLGLLLLRQELTAFLIALREGLFPRCLRRELRTLLHGTLASVVPDRLVCRHDVLLSNVIVGWFCRTTLAACLDQSKLSRLLADLLLVPAKEANAA